MRWKGKKSHWKNASGWRSLGDRLSVWRTRAADEMIRVPMGSDSILCGTNEVNNGFWLGNRLALTSRCCVESRYCTSRHCSYGTGTYAWLDCTLIIPRSLHLSLQPPLPLFAPPPIYSPHSLYSLDSVFYQTDPSSRPRLYSTHERRPNSISLWSIKVHFIMPSFAYSCIAYIAALLHLLSLLFLVNKQWSPAIESVPVRQNEMQFSNKHFFLFLFSVPVSPPSWLAIVG